MYNKILKKKKIFFFIKKIFIFKKKNFLLLGPIGNYSYFITLKKINNNLIKLKPLINIKSLIFNFKKIIPYENNNGGIVKDCLSLLYKKECFIDNVIILNIKHNFFLYKKKKILFLHNQSYKQIKNKIFFFLKKTKINFTNSNSNINNGFNICNFLTKKTFPINIKKISLKNNILNKTRFILNIKNNNKKFFLSFFCFKNIYLYLKKILIIYKKKYIYYFEIFLKSLRTFLFNMKKIKKITKILFVGFFNIL